jgi:hypothetical protein
MWGRDPGWLHTLDQDEIDRLFAWYRVHTDPQGPKTTKLPRTYTRPGRGERNK